MTDSKASEFVGECLGIQIKIAEQVRSFFRNKKVILYAVDVPVGIAHVLDGKRFVLTSSDELYVGSGTAEIVFKGVPDFLNYLKPEDRKKVFVLENKVYLM